MSKASKVWISLAVSLGVTILAAGISLPDFARSDGPKHTAPFVLPFALLVAYVFPSLGWEILWLALAQFPCYGIILGFAWVRNKLERVWWLLLLFHTLLGVGCMFVYSLDPY